MNNEQSVPKRNAAMDLARIIAILMVICIHVTSPWTRGEITSPKWHAAISWSSLCRSAVVMFFMISGAFYKDAPVSKTVKKIIKYTIIFFAASLVYSVSDAYRSSLSGGEAVQLGRILKGVANYKYHLWYLPAYIYVISIAPVLVKAIDHDNSRLTEYLLGLWIVFVIAANTVTAAVEGFEKFEMIGKLVKFCSSLVFLYGNQIGFFVLGRYLAKKQYPKKTRIVIYVLGLLSTAAMFFLTEWYSRYFGQGDTRWFEFNIFELMQAISLFVFFNNITVAGKFARPVTRIGKCTFGIYLIHVLFLDWGGDLKFLTESGIGGLEINPFLNIPLQVILLFLVSFVIVFVVKTIEADFKARS